MFEILIQGTTKQSFLFLRTWNNIYLDLLWDKLKQTLLLSVFGFRSSLGLPLVVIEAVESGEDSGVVCCIAGEVLRFLLPGEYSSSVYCSSSAFEIGDEGPTGANTAYQDRVCWEHKVEVDQKMRSIPLQHSKELAKRLCHWKFRMGRHPSLNSCAPPLPIL